MATTSTTPCRQEESASKIQEPCSDVIEISNKEMGGVDFTDKRAAAYHSDRRLTIRLYLGTLLGLMDVACANSYINYNMIYPNYLTLLNLKPLFQTT